MTGAGRYITASGSQSANWEDGIRKGKNTASVFIFDGVTSVNPYTSGTLKLTITEDYGETYTRIKLYPVMLDELPSDDMTMAQVMDLAQIKLGKRFALVKGDNTLNLPGYWLMLFANGEADGFLMTKADTDDADEAIFDANAELTLTVANGYERPYWMRDVDTGDVISDRTHTHIADFAELEYYLNIRCGVDSVQQITWTDVDYHDGLYAEWYRYVEKLQDKTTECLTAETKTFTFTEPTAGMHPKALLINELRQALETDAQQDSEQGAGNTFYIDRSSYSASSNYKYASGTPKGGYFYELVKVHVDYIVNPDGSIINNAGGSWITEKEWHNRVGLIPMDLTEYAGHVIQDAILHIKRTTGNDTFKIYAMKATYAAGNSKSVNTMFGTSPVVVATVNMGSGSEADVELNDTCKQMMHDGTIKGFGLIRGNNVVLSSKITLKVNYT